MQFWKEILLTSSDDNMMLIMDKITLPTTFFFLKNLSFLNYLLFKFP